MSSKKIADIIESMYSKNIDIPQDIKEIYLDYKYISKKAKENFEEGLEAELQTEEESLYTHSKIIDLLINTREDGGALEGRFFWDYETDRFEAGFNSIKEFIESGFVENKNYVEKLYRFYINSEEFKVLSQNMEDSSINIGEFSKLFLQELANKKDEDFLYRKIFTSPSKNIYKLA